MPVPGRLPSLERFVRILRLVAAMSVAAALVAVVAIMKGDLSGTAQALVAVAAALGFCALVGMFIAALPHVYRQKDKNDPRP